MEEIYWITRLDGIETLSEVLIGLAIFMAIMYFTGYGVCACNKRYHSDSDPDNDYLVGQEIKKISKPFLIVGIIGLLINLFVPTTKEALAIYGVGGTIDYIKSNDKAKQIPDKAVEALIKWLDTEQENKEGDKEFNK